MGIGVGEGVGELGEGGFEGKTKMYAATELGTSIQSNTAANHSFFICNQVCSLFEEEVFDTFLHRLRRAPSALPISFSTFLLLFLALNPIKALFPFFI